MTQKDILDKYEATKSMKETALFEGRLCDKPKDNKCRKNR